MNINLKTHLLGMRSAVYYYILGVAVAWGGFPFMAMLTLRMGVTIDKGQIFYSIFATVCYAILTYLGMYDIGVKDRRPYKWARYKAKGLVMGLMAFFAVYIIEVILIFIADRYAVVQHPVLDIKGVHGYITQVLYMTFFWISKILNPDAIMPSLNYLTALIPAVFVAGFNGFAYWMGYTEKVLIKNKPKGRLAQFLFYGHRKKKKTGWQEKLNEKFYDKDKKLNRKRDSK
ncbi:MAG: hypothetical protein E7388_05295 [Ruminococcaceae bacterium]|nr:hypothetical protein [Oscillospiraceae bacterium]